MHRVHCHHVVSNTAYLYTGAIIEAWNVTLGQTLSSHGHKGEGLKIWSRRLFLGFLPVQNTDPSNIWTSALNSISREWTLYWNQFLGCRHLEDSTHDICFHMLVWPNVFDTWRSIKWLREQRNEKCWYHKEYLNVALTTGSNSLLNCHEHICYSCS